MGREDTLKAQLDPQNLFRMNQNIPPVDEVSLDRLPDGQRRLAAHATRG
jgi:Berberine and berberine like